MDPQQLKINVQSRLLQPFEFCLRKLGSDSGCVIPVWIIGAPRSGTTLAYQVMCSAFRAYYLTNRVALRYRIAKTVRAWERMVVEAELKPASFRSDYGRTTSPDDPHEGGAFFYQYFPKEEPYSTIKDVIRPKELSRLISSVTVPYEVFISKNTYHSLRIKALSDLFPQSCFLWVYRDKVQNAHSLLKASEKHGVGDNGFWGITPPGWERYQNKELLKKVIWQIEETEKIIDHDLIQTDSLFYKVSYEDLCINPRQIIAHVASKFGIEEYLNSEEESEIPDYFQYSKITEPERIKEIEKAIANE